jgi:hypothetical protein
VRRDAGRSSPGVGDGARPSSVVLLHTRRVVVLRSYSSRIVAVCCRCHIVVPRPPRRCPVWLSWRRPVSSPRHRCDVSGAVSSSVVVPYRCCLVSLLHPVS